MKTTTKTLLSTATSVIALLGSSAAYAQTATATTTAPQPADDTTAADNQAIVVTGSLIRNPNLVLSNPVNVTTADQIELKQSNTAEEVLREIPGVVANIGTAVNNGNGGSSYVDLRGLGANRNIVLLDGNRIVPAGLAGQVDLNNIPLALVSRVDSLTGAAVTTYGADAITGVVNFITKKDFAGLDFSAGEQITEKGDGNYLRTDLTIGANFGDGKGNAVLSVGYQESDPVYQGARDFSAFQVESFSGNFGGSGRSVPARFSGTRPLIAGTNTPNTTPSATTSGNGGNRQLDASGAAVAAYNPFNFAPYNVFQVPFTRYNIFAQANYQVSDAIEVYTRGLFSKNEIKTIIAPSGLFDDPVTINLNNPLLPNTLRNQFCAFNTGGTGAYVARFDPATCAAAALATGSTDPRYRTVTVNVGIRAIDVGPRISDYVSQVFDYRIGARGGITDNVDWDVSGSYGESDKNVEIKNYTLLSRFRQGVLVNNVNGVATCQDKSNGCVPVNIFGGLGSITPAQAAFISQTASSRVRTELAQARGVISGDFGFTMPGANAPIGFALGSEFRHYRAQQTSDVLAKTPGELGGAGGATPDVFGGYEVYEGYAEVIAPIFDMLTIEGGARYSHYKVDGTRNTNNTFTYKGGATFTPIPDVKFRANYAHAVRAPNIAELFTPLTTGLTSLNTDPCAGAAPTTNANLRAVCLAQGAPASALGGITTPTAGQANVTSGGNVNLKPEKADTYTVGVVFQPSFLPRFSLSVDYYNIKVKDVIGSPLPGDLIAACFNNITAASATNPGCTSIRRDPLSGQLDGSSATTPGLFAPLNNLGRLYTDGIDVIANYNRDLGFAKWSINFVGNYTRHSKFQATSTSVNRECVGFYSSNCSFTGSLQPKYQWSLRNTFTFDQVDLSFLWRHIDKMQQEPLDINDPSGNGPAFQGALPATGGNALLRGKQVDFQHIPSYNIFDATARFNVSDNMTFTFAVQNLLNKQPPLVGTDISGSTFNSGNTYPSTYDALGRRYAVSARLRF